MALKQGIKMTLIFEFHVLRALFQFFAWLNDEVLKNFPKSSISTCLNKNRNKKHLAMPMASQGLSKRNWTLLYLVSFYSFLFLPLANVTHVVQLTGTENYNLLLFTYWTSIHTYNHIFHIDNIFLRRMTRFNIDTGKKAKNTYFNT